MSLAIKDPLYDVLAKAAPTAASHAEKGVERILHAVRTHLNMDVAFVSEFIGNYRFFHHVDTKPGYHILKPGDKALLEDGYCQRIIDGRLPQLIPDTARLASALAIPETKSVPIGSHISVPIRLRNGRVYGTFCCFSFYPDRSLNDRDLHIVRAFAELLAVQIDGDIEMAGHRGEKITRITTALAQGQPAIVYQPIIDLEKNRLAGLEGLSRFQTQPRRTPDIWFAEAEEVGLSLELELSALTTALTALAVTPERTYVAINCSPATLLSPQFHDTLSTFPLNRIVAEITEHAPVDSYEELKDALAPLRREGLRLSIDDAGAGYASLQHILHLDPEIIKLDMSLTRDIDKDSKRRALAAALIAFAREIGCLIIAEGIETKAELETIKTLGVHQAQGRLLGDAMPLGNMRGILQ